MATYYVSLSKTDIYSGDQNRRFKHRRFSKDGHPVAQELFDKFKRDGRFVRLIRWENDEWEEIESANVQQ